MLSDHEEYYNQMASEELGVRRLGDAGNTKLPEESLVNYLDDLRNKELSTSWDFFVAV